MRPTGTFWEHGILANSPNLRAHEASADVSSTILIFRTYVLWYHLIGWYDRMTCVTCAGERLKSIPDWDKLPIFFLHVCHKRFTKASVIAKCEYFHIHPDGYWWSFAKPFAAVSLPFPTAVKHASISAAVTRVLEEVWVLERPSYTYACTLTFHTLSHASTAGTQIQNIS